MDDEVEDEQYDRDLAPILFLYWMQIFKAEHIGNFSDEEMSYMFQLIIPIVCNPLANGEANPFSEEEMIYCIRHIYDFVFALLGECHKIDEYAKIDNFVHDNYARLEVLLVKKSSAKDIIKLLKNLFVRIEIVMFLYHKNLTDDQCVIWHKWDINKNLIVDFLKENTDGLESMGYTYNSILPEIMEEYKKYSKKITSILKEIKVISDKTTTNCLIVTEQFLKLVDNKLNAA